jgi:hypothetical protein
MVELDTVPEVAMTDLRHFNREGRVFELREPSTKVMVPWLITYTFFNLVSKRDGSHIKLWFPAKNIHMSLVTRTITGCRGIRLPSERVVTLYKADVPANDS